MNRSIDGMRGLVPGGWDRKISDFFSIQSLIQNFDIRSLYSLSAVATYLSISAALVLSGKSERLIVVLTLYIVANLFWMAHASRRGDGWLAVLNVTFLMINIKGVFTHLQ
jgi:hypothetical protein